MAINLVVRTSEQGWLARLAKAYKNHEVLTLVDDAKVGIDPVRDTLRLMGKRAKLNASEWAGVIVALGVTVIGVGLVVAAVLDPEPTSRLTLLVGGEVVCILSGGYSAIRTLTGQKPPSVEVLAPGSEFKLHWE